MELHKNNNSPTKKKSRLRISLVKPLKVTLDTSSIVTEERPVTRLHHLFQGFKQTYGPKGDVRR
ncbi:MAG: hypothetical protein KGZ85_07850 [Ignavibacterium sp.]|nr:hypothetical protein [Ignavibacterium sp.]